MFRCLHSESEHGRIRQTLAGSAVFLGLVLSAAAQKPPTTTTLAATSITTTTATLSESINPNGRVTHGWFQWGTTTNYGDTTARTAFGSGNSPVTISRGLTGLTPDTPYHFRAVGSNVLGVTYGADLEFTTVALPPRLVTTLADSGPGSLRQTIAEAISGDRILIVTNGTITNFTGELLLNKNLTIVGNGPTNIAVSGNRSSRVFNVAAGVIAGIAELTVREGKTGDGTSGASYQIPGNDGGDGGGILNAGSLALSNCVVTLCVTGRGGAGYNSATNNPNLGLPGGSGGNGGAGAGIYNSGNLTLVSCTLSRNTNGVGGAGGAGASQTTNSAAAGGGTGGRGGNGGGVFNAGTLALSRCTFELNSAGGGGRGGYGGACSRSTSSVGAVGGGGGAGGNGGGIHSQTPFSATNCQFNLNWAGWGGSGNRGGDGGVGPGFGSGGNGGGGGVGGNGGGVFGEADITLRACTFLLNSAGRGGIGGDGGWARFGYPNPGFGSDFWPGDGGAGGLGGDGGNGGGICSAAAVSLTSCTVAANYGGTGGDGGIGGEGGDHTVPRSPTDVWDGGDGGNGGAGGQGGKGGGAVAGSGMSALACTISGNRAGAGGKGGVGGYGGVSQRGDGGKGGDGGAGGVGGSGGGVVASGVAGAAVLRNALVAANNPGSGGLGGVEGRGAPPFSGPPYAGGMDGTRGANGVVGAARDVVGEFTSQGRNLIGLANGSSGFVNGVNGDLVGTSVPLDPQLDSCQDNGGDTLTCALWPGSPAFNAGDDSLLGPPFGLDTDQRGRPRQSGGPVDIGAYELQVAAGPIEITRFSRSGASPAELEFTGETGANYSVLMTTNCELALTQWTTLGSPSEVAPGQFQFTDAAASNKLHRFYRVRSP